MTAAASPQASSTLRSLALGYGPILITAAVLALLPLRYSDSGSMMSVITEGMLFAAYAVAFNIIFGSTGQLFLCVGALAGVGGFGSAILADRVGLPMVVTMLLAALASAVIGGLLSWVAVKRALDTIFVGIVTLAFSLSFESFILGRRDLTGGEDGLRISAGSGTILRDRVPPYFLLLGLVVVYLIIYRRLQRSRTGWAFRALRDDQLAAELAGVDVTRYRIFAGALGAAMLGFAGALRAHTGRGLIGTSTYDFGDVDVRVLVMLALGGIGTLLGPVIGAAALTWLDEVLVDYAQVRLVIYGVVIIALFTLFRRGLVPALTDLFSRLQRSPRAPVDSDDTGSARPDS